MIAVMGLVRSWGLQRADAGALRPGAAQATAVPAQTVHPAHNEEECTPCLRSMVASKVILAQWSP
jgi:hypothetical protein